MANGPQINRGRQLRRSSARLLGIWPRQTATQKRRSGLPKQMIHLNMTGIVSSQTVLSRRSVVSEWRTWTITRCSGSILNTPTSRLGLRSARENRNWAREFLCWCRGVSEQIGTGTGLNRSLMSTVLVVWSLRIAITRKDIAKQDS